MSLRVYGETTVDTFQSFLPRTLLEYSITLIDRFATLSRDHCLLSIGNHVKVTSLVSRDHPFFFIPLYLSHRFAFPLLKDAFDRYRAAIDFSRLSLPMSTVTTWPTTTEPISRPNETHCTTSGHTWKLLLCRRERKRRHTRDTPMDGEIRRDAGWRRTSRRRRDDTHKRVQRRNCRFVDTRPVYYLPTGYTPGWGKLGETRTRMRNWFILTLPSASIPSLDPPNSMGWCQSKNRRRPPEKVIVRLLFFAFYGSDAREPAFCYEKGTILLEVIGRKGCLITVQSRTSFRYTER